MFSSNNSTLLVGQFQKIAEKLSNGLSLESFDIEIASQKLVSSSNITYASSNINPISRPVQKNSCIIQPIRQSISPCNSSIGDFSNYSLSISPQSSFNISPQSISPSKPTNSKKLPIRSQFINMREHVENAKLNRINCNKLIYCAFCKSNGETEDIYSSHMLKDFNGKITCPILKVYKCPICDASGEQAHTITYCKKFKQLKRMENIQKNLKF